MVADRHRLAAYHNTHCWRAFQGYQHRWPWRTLNAQNRGFSEFFAILGYGVRWASEFSLKYTGDRPRLRKYEIKLMLWRVSWALAQISCYCSFGISLLNTVVLPPYHAVLRVFLDFWDSRHLIPLSQSCTVSLSTKLLNQFVVWELHVITALCKCSASWIGLPSSCVILQTLRQRDMTTWVDSLSINSKHYVVDYLNWPLNSVAKRVGYFLHINI